MTINETTFLKPKEVMKILRITEGGAPTHPGSFKTLLKHLKYIKVGSRYRIYKDSLEAFIGRKIEV